MAIHSLGTLARAVDDIRESLVKPKYPTLGWEIVLDEIKDAPIGASLIEDETKTVSIETVLIEDDGTHKIKDVSIETSLISDKKEVLPLLPGMPSVKGFLYEFEGVLYAAR